MGCGWWPGAAVADPRSHGWGLLLHGRKIVSIHDRSVPKPRGNICPCTVYMQHLDVHTCGLEFLMNRIPLIIPKPPWIWILNSAHPGHCYLNPSSGRASQRNSKTYLELFLSFFSFFWQLTAFLLLAESKRQDLTQTCLIILQYSDTLCLLAEQLNA